MVGLSPRGFLHSKHNQGIGKAYKAAVGAYHPLKMEKRTIPSGALPLGCRRGMGAVHADAASRRAQAAAPKRRR